MLKTKIHCQCQDGIVAISERAIQQVINVIVGFTDTAILLINDITNPRSFSPRGWIIGLELKKFSIFVYVKVSEIKFKFVSSRKNLTFKKLFQVLF